MPPQTDPDGRPLPGAEPLTLEGDLAATMVAGIDRYLMRELDASPESRGEYWNRDLSSHQNYEKSVEPDHRRLRGIIGLADPLEGAELRLVAPPLASSSEIATGSGYKVFDVCWNLLNGVTGEGLLLLPDSKLIASIIALPDCATPPPEVLVGLSPRPLLVEAAQHPEIPGPSPPSETRQGAAPGRLTTPPLRSVPAECKPARSFTHGLEPPAIAEPVPPDVRRRSPAFEKTSALQMRPPPCPIPSLQPGSLPAPASASSASSSSSWTTPSTACGRPNSAAPTTGPMPTPQPSTPGSRPVAPTATASGTTSSAPSRPPRFLPTPAPGSSTKRRVLKATKSSSTSTPTSSSAASSSCPTGWQKANTVPLSSGSTAWRGAPNPWRIGRGPSGLPPLRLQPGRAGLRGLRAPEPLHRRRRFPRAPAQSQPPQKVPLLLHRPPARTDPQLARVTPLCGPRPHRFLRPQLRGQNHHACARYPKALLPLRLLGRLQRMDLENASAHHHYSCLTSGEYEMPEFTLGNTFNYVEMSWLICPRPFMVERSHHDGIAPDEWVAYKFDRTRNHYVPLGVGDRTDIEIFDGPHTINGVGTFDLLHWHLKWRGST